MLEAGNKIIKNIEKVCTLLKRNFKKKLSFLKWYKKKKEIKNWFFLYCYYSSLIIDFFIILFGNKKWMQRLKARVDYSNGLSFYFPWVTSRYYSMFVDSEAGMYMDKFEKYYARKIHFQREDVVIDVGAHVGKFCVPLFASFPYLRILAFEPDPYNISCLQKTLEINNIDLSRFKAQALAIYGSAGHVSFSRGGVSTRGSITDAGFAIDNRAAIQTSVRAVTLDDVFKQHQIKKCKLLKMDCEGSEYEIFNNFSEHNLLKIDNLFIEVHPVLDKNPLSIKEFLVNKGFEVRGESHSYGCWEFFCSRNC